MIRWVIQVRYLEEDLFDDLEVPKNRPRHNLNDARASRTAFRKTANLSRKALAHESSLGPRPLTRGRRPCAVSCAPWRGLRRRPGFGAPFLFDERRPESQNTALYGATRSLQDGQHYRSGLGRDWQ